MPAIWQGNATDQSITYVYGEDNHIPVELIPQVLPDHIPEPDLAHDLY
jgi:hypothetical protein